MLNLKVLAAAAIAAVALIAPQAQAQAPQSNLISLFLVKRDNLTQQYRGELYPIVQYRNGRYVNASVDVTTDAREDAKEADIVQRNAAKSVLNTNPSTALLNVRHTGKLGDFRVNQIGVGQFACTSLLIGKGQLTSQSNWQTLFNQLPKDRQDGYRGSINGKPFDETWRWTVATQNTAPPATVSFTQSQFDQYRRDLVRVGATEIAKNPAAKRVKGRPVLEEVRVFDLNRDGKPEVFGRVRLKNTAVTRRDRGTVTNIYANVWLGYANAQPQLLSTQVVPYFSPASDLGGFYSVIGVIDANGDGKSEVLIRNNGHEGVNFSLYELQGNQLKSVFTGGGYGC